jgi:2-polyprenyl-3-methyl-5-hydroxy-6-metoxy-1,4-benzoquinol methylase
MLVADVGCGEGYGMTILERAGHRVVGFDVRRPQAPRGVPIVVCNCEMNTFEGFHAVVCLETIEHFIDPYAWLKNVNVQHLVLSTPITPSKDLNPWHKHDISREMLVEMLRPKWIIEEEWEHGESTKYLAVYARRAL